MKDYELKQADKALDQADRARIQKKLAAMIRRRYTSRDFLAIEQVRSGLGSRVRIADVLALGAWKSRDLSIHGLEIKTNRADWLSELEKPEKAEEIAQFCDYWWIVAEDPTIVRPEELPANWGLYIAEKDPLAKNDRLTLSVEAKPLSPKPPDREFLLSIVKRLVAEDLARPSEEILEVEHKRGRDEGYREGMRFSDGEKDKLIQWLNEQLFHKNKVIEKLSRHIGVSLRDLDTQSLSKLDELLEVFKRPAAQGLDFSDLSDAVRVIRSSADVEFGSILKNYGQLLKQAAWTVQYIETQIQQVRLARDQRDRFLPILDKIQPDLPEGQAGSEGVKR